MRSIFRNNEYSFFLCLQGVITFIFVVLGVILQGWLSGFSIFLGGLISLLSAGWMIGCLLWKNQVFTTASTKRLLFLGEMGKWVLTLTCFSLFFFFTHQRPFLAGPFLLGYIGAQSVFLWGSLLRGYCLCR